MADNVTLPATGAVVRTVANGMIETQVMKLDAGGESAESLVSATNPLPVSISSPVPVTGAFYLATQPVSGTVGLAAGVAAIGSVTVSGTTAANISQVGGSALAIGSHTSAASLPVVIASDQVVNASVIDAFLAPVTTTWNSATAINTAQTLATAGYDTVIMTFVPTAPITAGAITFEVYDGYNWLTLKAPRTDSYLTDTVFSLVGATTHSWQLSAAGYPQVRARLSTAIVGAGNVTVVSIVSSAPDVSLVTVGIDPGSTLPAGVNNIGAVTIPTGGTTVISGQALLAAAGTAQALPSNALLNGVTVTAYANNTGVITLGGAGVTNTVTGAGNGIRLQPGQSYAFSVSNSNAVYFNGTVTGDSIDFGGN
jgi:hypothetical protein